MMNNTFYFQIFVTQEQIEYANALVDYSIQYHPITDIFAHDPNGKARQREFRFTGTIGEVVFADTYGLPRPVRSFGAIDGQDFGQDFEMEINGENYAFDIKTMSRKSNVFRENYVLNLPKYQVDKNIKTDLYFCISIHIDNQGRLVASFIGTVSKQQLSQNKIGKLFVKGTRRVKDDGDSFIFQRDTYEVEFKDISSPMFFPNIEDLAGFKRLHILPAYKK